MKAPRVTITIALSAIVIALSPALQQALVLDRVAVAHGQLWRIVTGSLVHFSASHLLWDLLVVGVAGAILERDGWAAGTIVALAAVAIGMAFLVFEPGLARYGGLSGIACTLTVIAALDAACASGLTRWAGSALLILVAVKLWSEWRTGAFLFIADSGPTVRAVPLAHVAGALVGTIIWESRRVRGVLARRLGPGRRGGTFKFFPPTA